MGYNYVHIGVGIPNVFQFHLLDSMSVETTINTIEKNKNFQFHLLDSLLVQARSLVVLVLLSIPFIGFKESEELEEVSENILSIPFIGFPDHCNVPETEMRSLGFVFQFHLLDSAVVFIAVCRETLPLSIPFIGFLVVHPQHLPA